LSKFISTKYLETKMAELDSAMEQGRITSAEYIQCGLLMKILETVLNIERRCFPG
jgi:hypothetical protein